MCFQKSKAVFRDSVLCLNLEFFYNSLLKKEKVPDLLAFISISVVPFNFSTLVTRDYKLSNILRYGHNRPSQNKGGLLATVPLPDSITLSIQL